MKTYALSKLIILVNSATCHQCGETIESKYRHDYRTCSCGSLSVDGGKDYCKRVYDGSMGYTENSLESNDLLIARLYFKWNSYGKNGTGPKKEITLCEMDTEHILAILDTQQHIKGTYVEELFNLELSYRKDTNYA